MGAGSIGTRHAHNLLGLGADVALADADPDRAATVEGARGVAFDLDAMEGWDGVVVATPTAFHAEHALAALSSGSAVLVEKPLAAGEEGLDDLVAKAGERLTVGYNLRLHPALERFRGLLESGRTGAVTLVRAWFGSHLPDWRPAVDYRSTYSAQAALGGGVLLDASHELDLLVWMFGPGWTVEGAVMARCSGLAIDVEDVTAAVLRSGSGFPAVVTLDYVSARYRRGLEVVGADATLRLDWVTGTIEVEDASGITVEECSMDVDISYVREAEAFLALVRGSAGPVVSAEEGAATVRLCARIREAAGWPDGR